MGHTVAKNARTTTPPTSPGAHASSMSGSRYLTTLPPESVSGMCVPYWAWRQGLCHLRANSFLYTLRYVCEPLSRTALPFTSAVDPDAFVSVEIIVVLKGSAGREEGTVLSEQRSAGNLKVWKKEKQQGGPAPQTQTT